MKMFQLSFATLMWRYYLLMLVVLAAGFSGIWWLAFLGLPIVLSCLAGVSFGKRPETTISMKSARMPQSELSQNAA